MSSSNATSTIQSSMTASFSNVKTKADASLSGFSSRLQRTDKTNLGDNKALVDDQYVGAAFSVPDGYVFKIKTVSFSHCAISTGINARLTISDGDTEVTPSDGVAASGKTASISYSDDEMTKELSGDVTIKIWFWMPGSTSTGKYAGLGDLNVTGDLVESSAEPVLVTGIAITPSPASVKVGKTITLTPAITPSNATDKAVTWAVTSGSSYASVTDAGVVTGLAEGTATITATAHDGSGVTQTATVTVEECPTSGTIFSMNITAPSGTAYTGNNTFPALIGATYVGGQAYSGSKSGTNRTSTINDSGEYPFSANSELAIKIVMDCPLEEGDIIDITTSSSRQIKIQKVVGTDLYKTASKTFTIPEESALIGENVFYLMRENSESTLSSLTVTRPIYRTITLKYADGVTPDGAIEVIDGAPATKPTDPTWAHHRFDGWYNGATPYDWTANVTSDLTLTAHWTQLYTITYAAGEGTAIGDAPTQVDKAEGETFTVAANTFEVAGKDFVKWNDGTNDYAPGATYTVGTDNIVLTAQWKAAADKYTVIFKDGMTELGTKLFDVTTNPSDADIDKTKALNTFAAWQKEGVDIALDDAFWATVAKDAEITLTARWAAAYALNVNFKEAATQDLGVETALNTYHYASDASDISFEEKGLKIKTNAARFYFNVAPGKVAEIKFGNISGATYSVDGGAAETLTSSQLKATYSASAQSCVMTMTTAAYNIVEKVTIHDPFTVKFDANGGDDIAAVQGKPSITLPEPTNGTMNFKGWYDAATEGNKIGDAGEEYTPTADVTIYAQWEAQSTINTLSDLKVNGETVLGFAANEHTYRMVLPYKSALPMITSATPTNANATFALWPVDGPEWTDEYDGGCYRQQVVVTPQDPTAEKGYYDIRITIAPKDGVSIISIAVPNGNGNEQTIAAANITGYIGGTATQKLQSGGTKLGSNGHYIGFTLANSETLKEGDVIRLNVSATNGASHLTLYQNASDANPVKDIEWEATTGVNLIPLPAEAAGLSTLYIYRKTAVCNPNLSEFTILRPTNPILKAITIDGRDGEIDEDNKKVTVELPFSSNVASMIVEPTIAWNAPAATNAIVVNDGSDWVVGDNTYVLTDKDGDQTTYTITLTQAAASADATLKTLTINGSALALVDGVYEYDYELPYGTTTAPEVEAEANDANATAGDLSVSLTEAVITVTAANGATQEYVINFTVSPWQNIVIWDGSTMNAVAASPDASGLTWEINGFGSIAKYTTTCGSKTYSKVLPSGGSASDSRNFKIVIPDGYLAKFYIAFASHSDGELRGMSIGTNINKNSDTSIYGAECNTRLEALGGTSVIVGAGTYYINPRASIDFCEVSVLLRPGYIRTGLTVGSLGTICLPSNVPAGHAFGATFYELKGKEPQYGKIVFDEILSGELAAGVPYLFQAQSDVLYCFYGTTTVTDPINSGAMKGTFVNLTLTDLTNIYYFAQKALWSCVDLTSLSVPANRAYVQMDEMPDNTESNPAPGVRRITLGVNGQQVATGVDQVQGDGVPTKMIINGQLFILCGEKMYDAQGKLVK